MRDQHVILDANPAFAGQVNPRLNRHNHPRPKLFVASEQDTNARFADTRTYFERAPEPKRFQSFPGSEHGVRLFAGTHGDALRTLLLDFVA